MKDRAPSGRYAIALVLVASLTFATSSPLARLARPAHPLVIAFGRVFLASIVLALFDLPGLARSWKALTNSQTRGVVIAGLLLGAHFALFQWGLDTTSLPAAVSLVSLEPLGVVLSAWVAFGIRPRRLEMIGVALATAGAVLVGHGAGEGENKALGDLLVLGSVALFGVYVAIARGLRDAIPARHYAPLVYGAAAIGLAVALPFAHPFSSPSTWPIAPSSIGYIALIALIPTIVGHTLVQSGARDLSPSVIALVSPGETLGSIILAAILFETVPSWTEAFGGVVILGGAGLAMVAQRRGAASLQLAS